MLGQLRRQAKRSNPGGAWLSPIFLGIYLVALPGLAQEPGNIRSTRGDEALELSWSDAEEQLKGSIRPAVPRAGQPLEISVHIGTFQGEAFNGPVTFGLRRGDERIEQTRTVAKSGAGWGTSFLPERAGSHVLSVAFHSTRRKVSRVEFEVQPAFLSQAPLWGLGVIFAAGLVWGALRALRASKPKAPEPVEPGP